MRYSSRFGIRVPRNHKMSDSPRAIGKGGIAVLSSGGVDSAVLLHHLADTGEPIHPVFVRQGFRWERAEVLWLERFLEQAPRPEFRPLEVLVLPLADLYPEDHFGRAGEVPLAGEPDEECYLPGRNVTVLAKAGVFAAVRNLRAVALGPLKSNPFPDATPGFFRRMARVLTEGLDHPLEILAPLLAFTKEEVLLLGKRLPLQLTFSCMEPAGELHCGRCAKCGERRQAFRASGLPDPTRYAANS
jgi:7-cyano-7-deazaguanine synthase